MQLKQNGKRVAVTFHKPELRKLAAAREVLECVAVLPCDERELAETTVAALTQLAASMTPAEKVETGVDTASDKR